MLLIPLKVKDKYLCMDTEFYNELNFAHIEFTWDYTNNGIRFQSEEDYQKALKIKTEIDNREEIVPLPKKTEPKKQILRRLF